MEKWLSEINGIDAELKLLNDIKQTEQRTAAALKCGNRRAYKSYLNCIDVRMSNLMDKKQNRIDVINQLTDDTSRQILLLRFIHNKTWEQIADEMMYCTVHIQMRLFKKAIAEITKIYNDNKHK